MKNENSLKKNNCVSFRFFIHYFGIFINFDFLEQKFRIQNLELF